MQVQSYKGIKQFKYSELQKLFFLHYPESSFNLVADGGDSNRGGYRSLWYDEEAAKRTPRGLATNVDRDPQGSGDVFFNPAILRRIQLETIRPAKYRGELQFTLKTEGENHIPKITHYYFKEGGRGRFYWWGKLIKGRPDQRHNYIVACDIARGMGSSNSVAQIVDANTNEQVGVWVCPNTTPDAFADQAVAICKWCGGLTRQAYLIWEENGPGGAFDQRRRKLGYSFVYTRKNERARVRKRKQTFGWHSGRVEKYDLLQDLDLALANGLKTNPSDKFLILRDGQTLTELETYITFESGQIGPSGLAEDSSGAKAAHGDRVIALALTTLAMKEQPKAAALKENRLLNYSSFTYRFLQRQKKLNQPDFTRKFLI